MSKSEHQRVFEAVDDRFYEEGEFSSVRDIAEWTGISENKVRNIVEDLEGNQLFRVYEGHGKPTLYISLQMKNSLTADISEPDWLNGYEFSEKKEFSERISEYREKISDYQKFERLLYTSGTPLEESVIKSLEFLGLQPEETSAEEDVRFRYKDNLFICEIKGKSGPARKEDVAQLGTWLDKWAGKEKAETLRGTIFINHERHDDPEEREDALTEGAREFLNLRGSTAITTKKLFDAIKEVKEGDKTKDKALEILFS